MKYKVLGCVFVVIILVVIWFFSQPNNTAPVNQQNPNQNQTAPADQFNFKIN